MGFWSPRFRVFQVALAKGERAKRFLKMSARQSHCMKKFCASSTRPVCHIPHANQSKTKLWHEDHRSLRLGSGRLPSLTIVDRLSSDVARGDEDQLGVNQNSCPLVSEQPQANCDNAARTAAKPDASQRPTAIRLEVLLRFLQQRIQTAGP
jgi:hypothetical protein